MLARLVLVCAFASAMGCAGAQLMLPQPDYSQRANLAREFGGHVEPSRNIDLHSRQSVVERVDLRILPAADRVCQRTFSGRRDCYERLRERTIVVAADDEGINASVGMNYDLTILGGLVRETGSDDELAFVMAHEYAHALFGHVSRRVNNALWATLIGGLAGAATAAAVGADQYAATDITLQGASVGQMIGATAFSKDMELEADHLALFILHDAGYDMNKGMEFFRRTLQIQATYHDAGQGQTIGFFRTHPSDEERLLQLIATKEMIERGVDRPIWNQ